jgi:serine/threonine-protein kinase
VAPGNLLLPESGSGILVDVRCAKPAHSGGQTRYSEEGAILLGTLPYLAPEVLEGQPVTEVAEVHALALTILASMHGRLPWSGARSPLEVLGNTERSSAASLATGTDLPGQIVDILAAMLDEIPGNRPSAAEVVLQFRRARSRED